MEHLLIGATTANARYIEADPLGLVDGASVYGYALQNPNKYIDPRGTAVQVRAIPGFGQAACAKVVEVCVAAGVSTTRRAIRRAMATGASVVFDNDCTDDECGGGDDLVDFTDHGMDRMIERGITPDQIKDALQNPQGPPEDQGNWTTK